MTRSIFSFIGILAAGILAAACSTPSDFLPKPRGYHRIVLPQHLYRNYDEAGKPYTFIYSQHAQIQKDTSFRAEPHDLEIIYPAFNATVSISYKSIGNNPDSLASYFNTSLKLTNKHHIRAAQIEEYEALTENGYTAIISELSGDVPTQFQFFVTDSTDHFLRAALYFPTSSKNDSLAPVIAYVRQDLVKLMNSLDWRRAKPKK